MDTRSLLLIGGGTVALFLVVLALVLSSLGGSAPSTGAEPATAADRTPPYWIVREGQSYGTIAERTGLSIDRLITLNPRRDPRRLRDGQAIKLRSDAPPRRSERRRGPRTWIVRRGDSFSSISEKTGHSILQIERLNPRIKPTALRPGQRIRLRR